MPSENTAHGDDAIALIATSARNAIAMAVTTTRNTEMMRPPTLPISSVAI